MWFFILQEIFCVREYFYCMAYIMVYIQFHSLNISNYFLSHLLVILFFFCLIISGQLKSLKTRYWIISFLCVLHFCVCSDSLLFTPNPGHYMPNYPCSSPNVPFLMLKSLSEYVPMITVPPVNCGGVCGGGGVARMK